MTRFLVLLALSALTFPPVRAQVSEDSTKSPLERTPEIEAAEAVALAAALAAYGRRAGSAQALIAAAAILIDHPTPLGRFEGEEAEEAGPAPLDPLVLLDEAESLVPPGAAVHPQIMELRATVPNDFPPLRGAERGPIRYAAAVAPEAMRQHALTFRGRETATFHLVGQGTSDLDYYLYDVNGELVASNDGPSDAATLIWYVPYRQRLTLRVRNRGDSRNGYHIVTN